MIKVNLSVTKMNIPFFNHSNKTFFKNAVTIFNAICSQLTLASSKVEQKFLITDINEHLIRLNYNKTNKFNI